MSTPTRTQWIADARAVLDLLESNPDLPLNLASGMTVNYYPLGNVGDIEAMAAVDAVADALGAAVTPPGPGSHYEAEICFGSASYKAIAVLKDYRDRRAAIDRLGEAALDADSATEAFVDAADAERYAQRDEYVNGERTTLAEQLRARGAEERTARDCEAGDDKAVPDFAQSFGSLGAWADAAVLRAVRETIAESEADR